MSSMSYDLILNAEDVAIKNSQKNSSETNCDFVLSTALKNASSATRRIDTKNVY